MTHIETADELIARLHTALTVGQSALDIHQRGMEVLTGNFGEHTIQAIAEITASAIAMCDVARVGDMAQTPNDLVKQHPETLSVFGRFTGALVPMVIGIMIDLELR